MAPLEEYLINYRGPESWLLTSRIRYLSPACMKSWRKSRSSRFGIVPLGCQVATRFRTLKLRANCQSVISQSSRAGRGRRPRLSGNPSRRNHRAIDCRREHPEFCAARHCSQAAGAENCRTRPVRAVERFSELSHHARHLYVVRKRKTGSCSGALRIST